MRGDVRVTGITKGGTTGFARLTRAERSVMASKGGKAAHAKGNARRWTAEEAREAGKRAAEARKR